MGLDISYVNKLTFLREEDGTDYAWPEEMRLYPNPDFPAQADGLKDGIYKYEDVGEFHAGSYSGYNQWRNQLAQLAGYGSAEQAWTTTEGPFRELINFSDCGGVIGSITSAKLAKDFAEYQHAADQHQDSYFLERYNFWRKAFEVASNAGAVCFH